MFNAVIWYYIVQCILLAGCIYCVLTASHFWYALIALPSSPAIITPAQLTGSAVATSGAALWVTELYMEPNNVSHTDIHTYACTYSYIHDIVCAHTVQKIISW